MFEKEVYVNRRKKLMEKLSDGIALFLGNVESPMNYTANTYRFRQDSSFLYFFGLDFPGLAGVIDFDNGNEYIFGNDVDMDDIIWMGPQVPIQENARRAGITRTAPLAKLFGFIQDSLKNGRKVHILPPYRAENKLQLENLLSVPSDRVREFASVDLIKAVVNIRSVKEKIELEEIKKACAIGYKMHVTAMQMAKPGVWEQHIAGTIEGIAAAGGGMISFPVILSQNGETLHNHDHSQYLEKGDYAGY
jgi:Xaa-Pro aminopeptidase